VLFYNPEQLPIPFHWSSPHNASA